MRKRLTKEDRGYDIVIFDCDSTLSKIEGIDESAKLKGKENEVRQITRKAMEGRMSFRRALRERLSIVQPNRKDLVWLGGRYIHNALPDAKKVIKRLLSQGKQVYLISGGYQPAIEIFAQNLGIDKRNVLSIGLVFDRKGKYLAADWQNPLSKNNGKKLVLRRISRKGKTLFVGDGATDLEARDAVDLFVGFGGVIERPIVKKNAPVFISKPTLKPILNLALGRFIKRSKNVSIKKHAKNY